jgi:hypothetical protein
VVELKSFFFSTLYHGLAWHLSLSGFHNFLYLFIYILARFIFCILSVYLGWRFLIIFLLLIKERIVLLKYDL